MELPTLSVPVLSKTKRKLDEPSTVVEPPKKPKVDRWSFFTKSQVEVMLAAFADILKESTAASVENADTHFVLHLSRLSGLLDTATFNKNLAAFNKLYKVRSVQVHLAKQFIDVRFRLRTPGDAGSESTNVVRVGQRHTAKLPEKLLGEAKDRDVNDWLLVSVLMNHAEAVLGPDTPELEFQVKTPDGRLLTTSGAQEIKDTRHNYEFVITGYRHLHKEHIDSFEDVLPFHTHTPVVDFDAHALRIAFEKYSAPRTGQIKAMYSDVDAVL